MKKQVLFFLFNGYTDFECAHALAGIAKSRRHDLKTIALEKDPVRSLAGMNVLPDLDFRLETDLSDIDPLSTAMLILPGGTAWEDKRNREILPLVRHCVYYGIPVAASCSATVMLADAGVLNARLHTSCHIEYLKAFSPLYNGAVHYREAQVMVDENVITTGTAGMEFSDAIFDVLGIREEDRGAEWLRDFPNKMVSCVN